MSEPTCYVCERPIREKALYIGQGLYRHPVRCEPGSVGYMRNPALAGLFNLIMGRSSSMKQGDVKVGGVYAAKVSDKVVPVRIDREHPAGGWVGTNQETGKEVRVKTARRLHAPWPRKGAKGEQKPEAKQDGAEAKKSAPRAPKGAQERGLSGLDAAAKVLQEAGEPLDCKTIVERAFEKGYWRSDGKTPAATIYSAILREIQAKGPQARFRKASRGKFEVVQINC